MIILGINDAHDASACLIVNGKIIGAIQEERISRKKGVSSFPINSIKYLLNKNKIYSNQIDHVCFANNKILNMTLWNIHCDFGVADWFKLHEDYYYPRIYKKKKITLREIFPHYKPSSILGYDHRKFAFISNDESSFDNDKKIQNMRIKTICKLLKISKEKVSFFDHHRCHAFYGFYTSNFKKQKVAVITADGGGDGIYNTVSLFQKGFYKNLVRSRNNLIGKIYSSVTLILGLNPFRHVYKVMGLAPHANRDNYLVILNFFLKCLKVNKLDFYINKKIKDFYFYFKKNLEHYRFDNIAGALQKFTELRFVELFKNISYSLKLNNFVFSGGVANNVKVNQLISNQKFVKNFWVPPGPGDESLCIGSVYSYIYDKLGAKKALNYIKKPNNAYWGPDIENKNIQEFKKNKIIKKNFIFYNDKNFIKSAKLLNSSEIIFVLFENQEFGQRALGHRSIVCNPSDTGLVKKINTTIKMRDFWMPFTPSILNESRHKYFKNIKNINYNYMTICADTTLIGKKHLAAAIHSGDETIRPQLVSKNTCPKYFKLIKAFQKRSGIGAVLNTSLNMHEFPIITQPTDIIKEILKYNKKINFNILIENNLFIRKNLQSNY